MRHFGILTGFAGFSSLIYFLLLCTAYEIRTGDRFGEIYEYEEVGATCFAVTGEWLSDHIFFFWSPGGNS